MDATDGSSAPIPLILTGERTLPGIPEENYWFQRHVLAYEFAASLARGRVLDAGCGEGYGAALLARSGATVTATDLEPAVVEHATTQYPSVRFEVADLTALPYSNGSFDAVVSLQVIEHLPNPRAFIAECARVLAPGGALILSTPNRLTFSPDGLRNPFHTVEFSPAELRNVITEHLHVERLTGTFHAFSIRAFEIVSRTPFPERLITQPVPEWSSRLRKKVAGVTVGDFRIRDRNVDRSLDLVAVARRR